MSSLAKRLTAARPLVLFRDVFASLDEEDQAALRDALLTSSVQDVLDVTTAAGLPFTFNMLRDAKTRFGHEAR